MENVKGRRFSSPRLIMALFTTVLYRKNYEDYVRRKINLNLQEEI